MTQIEIFAIVDGYFEAIPRIVYSIQFSIHLLHLYWYCGEKSQIYLLGKRVHFLARYLNIMGFSFVCPLTHTLTKQKGIMIVLRKISQSNLYIYGLLKIWTTLVFAIIFLCYAKSLQSCPTLCDPIEGSPPGSPVPGILQARTLEWVAISFSHAWKWKVKVKSLSRVRL